MKGTGTATVKKIQKPLRGGEELSVVRRMLLAVATVVRIPVLY